MAKILNMAPIALSDLVDFSQTSLLGWSPSSCFGEPLGIRDSDSHMLT